LPLPTTQKAENEVEEEEQEQKLSRPRRSKPAPPPRDVVVCAQKLPLKPRREFIFFFFFFFVCELKNFFPKKDIKKLGRQDSHETERERERDEVLLPPLSFVLVFVGVRWWEKRGALRQECGVFFFFFFFFVRAARARPRRDGNGQVLTEITSRFSSFWFVSSLERAPSRFFVVVVVLLLLRSFRRILFSLRPRVGFTTDLDR